MMMDCGFEGKKYCILPPPFLLLCTAFTGYAPKQCARQADARETESLQSYNTEASFSWEVLVSFNTHIIPEPKTEKET